MIASKKISCLTGRKTARVVLNKKAKGCESPHEPVKKRRINVKFCGNDFRLLRVIPSEMFKDPELGAGIENLAAPPPVDQIEYFVGYRAHVSVPYVDRM